eukprot:3458504-Lingulodinium_polyedra.AAC.1
MRRVLSRGGAGRAGERAVIDVDVADLAALAAYESDPADGGSSMRAGLAGSQASSDESSGAWPFLDSGSVD